MLKPLPEVGLLVVFWQLNESIQPNFDAIEKNAIRPAVIVSTLDFALCRGDYLLAAITGQVTSHLGHPTCYEIEDWKKAGLAMPSVVVSHLLRGEIYWADLDPLKGRGQAGKRPVLIMSHDIFNEKSGTVIALAITSKEPRAGYPLSMKLGTEALPKISWVKISQIRTLSKVRLGQRIGAAMQEELDDIIEGLMDIIG